MKKDTTIFICQLSEKVQKEIKRLVIEYLTKEESKEYALENIQNIMDDRLENINQLGFEKEFEYIISLIESEESN